MCVIMPFLTSRLTRASCSMVLLIRSSSKVTVSSLSSFSAMSFLNLCWVVDYNFWGSAIAFYGSGDADSFP